MRPGAQGGATERPVVGVRLFGGEFADREAAEQARAALDVRIDGVAVQLASEGDGPPYRIGIGPLRSQSAIDAVLGVLGDSGYRQVQVVKLYE